MKPEVGDRKGTCPGDIPMDENVRWLSNADLTPYGGEWIIVANCSVVAHGPDLEVLYEVVDREHPDEERVTVFVPEGDLCVF
jgi:hypothetical protein